MIDQTTKIEQRIDAIESSEERQKYESLKTQANVSFGDICWTTRVIVKALAGNAGEHQALHRAASDRQGEFETEQP